MNKEPIEHIVWKERGETLHALCFIVDEKPSTLTLSLTKSFGEFVDIKKVNIDQIISRNPVDPTVRIL